MSSKELIREAFIPGLATVRACIDCGVLISGGPTRCIPCAFESDPSHWARIKYRIKWLFGRKSPWVSSVLALVLATSTAHAGADINLVWKGSAPTADVPAIATGRDFLVFGDGTGPSKIKAARAASPSVPIAVYVKAGGVRSSDAEWADAQSLLWRQPNGEPYTQSQNGWAFGDIQRFPNQWAAVVVVPHLRASLAGLDGVVDWIFVDNVLYQDASLFLPQRPPDYDAKLYHAATLVVLQRIREAFPGRKLGANGWQGGAPQGLRGEVLPGLVDGVWFECWYAKCSGKAPTPDRFAQDQGALISLARAGLVTVVDEPGLQPYSPAWREAFGVWVATMGRAGVWANAYFNLSAAPWVEALR